MTYQDLEPDRVYDPDNDDVEHLGDNKNLFICTAELPDGSVCGASFETKASLNGHKAGKHRDRSGDRPRGTGAKASRKSSAKPRTSAPREQKPATERATDRATGPSTSRTTTYQQTLSMFAVLAYFVIPRFDDYDLGVCNNGIPNLATALDLVGNESENFRRACDVILGGGTGGAYVALLFAVAGIAGPIGAHHRLLPQAIGTALGQTSGVAPPTTTPEAPTPPENDAASPQGVWDPNSPEGVLAFMSGVPPTVLADVTGRMMSMDQATVVGVPTFPTEAPPDGPGPEQLKPTLLDGLPIPGNDGSEAESVRAAAS